MAFGVIKSIDSTAIIATTQHPKEVKLGGLVYLRVSTNHWYFIGVVAKAYLNGIVQFNYYLSNEESPLFLPNPKSPRNVYKNKGISAKIRKPILIPGETIVISSYDLKKN